MPTPSIHAFAEKVAVVSGGDSPYGRAVALQLALQGCYVIVGTNGDEKSALGELERLGTLAQSVESDVSTAAGAAALAGAAANSFGRIDLLVNCLTIPPSAADFGAANAHGANAADLIVRAARELLESRPKPRIVNVFPDADTDEAASDPLFAASHHAVAGLTRSLARALPKKFRVNGVAVSSRRPEESVGEHELFRRPTGVSPDDVARAVLFLLSGEAAGVNGQIVFVG